LPILTVLFFSGETEEVRIVRIVFTLHKDFYIGGPKEKSLQVLRTVRTVRTQAPPSAGGHPCRCSLRQAYSHSAAL